MGHIKDVSQQSKVLMNRLQLLRNAFKEKNVENIVETFGFLEKNLNEFEANIENVENKMHLQLKNCFVAFDVDPHLVDKISDRKLSQSAYDRYRDMMHHAFFRHFSIYFILISFILISFILILFFTLFTAFMYTCICFFIFCFLLLFADTHFSIFILFAFSLLR